VREFQPVSTNLAFANAPDFVELLLDTTVKPIGISPV
jgi:hypothetical protein